MEKFPDLPNLPWKAFGPELLNLTGAAVNKLDREWPHKWHALGGAAALLELLARTVHNTFRTILVLSPDKPEWPMQEEYALSVGPLARTILDILFAVIYLFDDLPSRTALFYKGGWRENWEEHQRHLEKYGRDPEWAEWLSGFGGYLDAAATQYGLTDAEKTQPKDLPYWPIPSRMLKDKTLPTDRVARLTYLNDWFYKSLSSQSHASLPGLVMRSAALIPRQDPEERAWKLGKQRSDQVLVTCLLCLAFVSEIEIECGYGLARRLQYVWRLLAEHFGMAKELYGAWYETRLNAVAV